ncbi:MAG TPA: hypothetical protein VGN19_05730 [Pedococcus sp.]|jgi:hypothetical protein|nr:hypothetical protein [Pedococcus sp.]
MDETEADRRYDEDVATIRDLMFDFTEGLAAAGLAGDGDIRVEVRCYARSGVPIEMTD